MKTAIHEWDNEFTNMSAPIREFVNNSWMVDFVEEEIKMVDEK